MHGNCGDIKYRGDTKHGDIKYFEWILVTPKDDCGTELVLTLSNR